MKIFDTHTHYDERKYGKSADVLIQRILADNVAGFMAVGHSVSANFRAVELAEAFAPVFASVGIHPHYAKEGLPADYLTTLEGLAAHTKVVAIGECGLDYHYDGYERDTQIAVFREQSELAAKLNLPVIVHSRDATEDTMAILKEFKPRAVMHCFSGSVETMRELVKLGILVSFTGVLTFPNARRAAEVVKEIPLEYLMLETDCPYMAPQKFRGKTCDSSMLGEVAEKVAQIRGMGVEEVVTICNNNAKRFFGITF
ncbi:MAG: TatD family hydrolase [Oscillospiraceae bacterium]|nr:TatD family hydrolase [Oscillospiraceae bacterium]